MASDLIRFMQVLFFPAAHAFEKMPWRPAMDVYRTRTGWLVKCELAGVRAEDLYVTVAGSRLTVRGRRRDWVAQEEYCCYGMDIIYGHFERIIDLPDDLESARLGVDYRDGMLVVHIDTEATS